MDEIRRISVYESNSNDPYYNLAVEQHLLEAAGEDRCTLYLWQNENTVVIGRNQNAWKECRTELLRRDGVRLARRLSGGGAVFHDLGNLNFTFLMPQHAYNLDLQFSVIQRALLRLGIETERSGRNDILASGRKFSGNAFYKNGTQAYHHGTLLFNLDMEKLGRYLSPSKAKLQAKGVESVRSRVVNLKEMNPDLTLEAMKQALRVSFEETYQLSAQTLGPEQLDADIVEKLRQRNCGWEWNYGRDLPFTCTLEDRFSWGGIQIDFRVDAGVIEKVRVHTDAMDWRLAENLEKMLTGCRFTSEELLAQLRGDPREEDLGNLIRNGLQ